MRKPHVYWDAPWNPVTGCSGVSDGCQNCWARTTHNQRHKAYHEGKKLPEQYRQPFSIIQIHRSRLNKISGGKNKTIFVCNTSDLFHPNVPDEFAELCYRKMEQNLHHRFLILTKRPENIRAMSTYPNIWLGTTCENQKYADERIPHLLATLAANRWLSLEPLLGEIDITETGERSKFTMPWASNDFGSHFAGIIETPGSVGAINWVVIGAESGANRRPCKLDWVYFAVDQCQNAQVPVFVKQLDLDGKCVHDIEKFPKDLQIRELPWRQP